jgi:hypothetical protein
MMRLRRQVYRYPKGVVTKARFAAWGCEELKQNGDQLKWVQTRVDPLIWQDFFTKQCEPQPIILLYSVENSITAVTSSKSIML